MEFKKHKIIYLNLIFYNNNIYLKSYIISEVKLGLIFLTPLEIFVSCFNHKPW